MHTVYHGSEFNFDIAKPNYNVRAHLDTNKKQIIDYKGVSLHVTPYKWIALAYTYTKRQYFIHNGKKYVFNMGVDLKKKPNHKIIYIYGKRSLEYSLNKLYGNGGYLYLFDKKHFKRVKGIGINELISYTEQIPKKKIFLKNPVKEMEKIGVKFNFIDITKKQW